jgi:hypothetical protein
MMADWYHDWSGDLLAQYLSVSTPSLILITTRLKRGVLLAVWNPRQAWERACP